MKRLKDMRMNYSIVRTITLLIIVLAVTSCLIPAKKERYLLNFERFVTNVERNADKFKEKDWRYANRRYRLYSEEWYKNFSKDLTLKEQLQVAGLKLRYTAVKERSQRKGFPDDKVREEIERLGRDIDRYLDENLDRDLEKLSKGAREIGDSAIKVMEDLLSEIKRRKDRNTE